MIDILIILAYAFIIWVIITLPALLIQKAINSIKKQENKENDTPRDS